MIQPLGVQVFEVSVAWPATVFREMVDCRKIPGNLPNDFDSNQIFGIGAYLKIHKVLNVLWVKTNNNCTYYKTLNGRRILVNSGLGRKRGFSYIVLNQEALLMSGFIYSDQIFLSIMIS